MFATAPDLLRLLIVPVFAWAALRDVRTRRLPNRMWPPLYLFGLLLIAWEAVALRPFGGFEGRLFLVQVAVSLLFVAPLGYAFWYLGAFGGADAKALIAIALLFPTFPTYYLSNAVLPLVLTDLGVFSLTVLTNTVLIGLAYPVALGAANLARGDRSPWMFLARPVDTSTLPERHGRLFEDDEGFTRSGLDLDALRMYLRWRGKTLADVRENPDYLRDPQSVVETHDPTDGGTHVGPVPDGGSRAGDDTGDAGDEDALPATANDSLGPDPDDLSDHVAADPWAAERFLDELEGTAYGTDAETLRGGLELVAARDRVWVSPGLPFVVPMFLGLVVALVFGDLLFAAMGAVGLV
ncbi:A24 family peptidase [Halorubrum gandharaense]